MSQHSSRTAFLCLLHTELMTEFPSLMGQQQRRGAISQANMVLEVHKENVSRKGKQQLKLTEDQSSPVDACMAGQHQGQDGPPGWPGPKEILRTQERGEKWLW